MAKYHISTTTGKPALCKAKKKCPLGGESIHFNASTRQEANEHYEKHLSKNNNGNHTSKKQSAIKFDVPQSIKSDRNCNRKIRRLYSSGMNVSFYTKKEEIISQKQENKKEHLVDSQSSDIDFITDDVNEIITREEILKLGSPFKSTV